MATHKQGRRSVPVRGRFDEQIEQHVRVFGDLTMHCVTNEIPLDVEFEGRIVDPWGKDRAAFSATTQINRKEFGLTWDGLTKTGGAVVGDKVKIELHIEAVRLDDPDVTKPN